jgi:hypothetical protein
VTADRWNSWPSFASQNYFQESMEAHTKVRSVEKVTPGRWDLMMTNGVGVQVFITDVYTFSASDYAMLRAKYPEVDIIVQASGWNHFSTEAEENARADGVVTVHLGGGLMSVLHEFAQGRAASG